MSLLIGFDRLNTQGDLCEQISHVLLQPLRTAIGEVVEYEKIGLFPFYEQNRVDVIIQLAAGIFALIITPITLFGLLLAQLSTTYDDLLQKYVTLQQRVNDALVEKNLHSSIPTSTSPIQYSGLTEQAALEQLERLQDLFFHSPWRDNNSSKSLSMHQSQVLFGQTEPIYIRPLNIALFEIMHAKGYLTLRETMTGFSQRFHTKVPLPILENPQVQVLEDGKLYRPRTSSTTPAEDCSAIRPLPALFLRRVGDRIYNIDDGRGAFKVSIFPTPGDPIYINSNILLGTVGMDGNLLYHNPGQAPDLRHNKGWAQSKELFESLLRPKQTATATDTRLYTRLENAVELSMPVLEGFVLPSLVSIRKEYCTTPQGHNTFTVYCPRRDKQLRKVIAYLELEKKELKLGEELFLHRLISFCIFAFKESDHFPISSRHVFLGDLVNTRRGNSLQRAFLFKVLAQHFGYDCTLIVGAPRDIIEDPRNQLKRPKHPQEISLIRDLTAWIGMDFHGTKRIVDLTHHAFFPIDYLPARFSEPGWMKAYYGLPGPIT